MVELKSICQELLNFIKNNILADGVELNFDSELREAGLDSYSIVEIILFLERKYGVVIPDDLLQPKNFHSITAIATTAQKLIP